MVKIYDQPIKSAFDEVIHIVYIDVRLTVLSCQDLACDSGYFRVYIMDKIKHKLRQYIFVLKV